MSNNALSFVTSLSSTEIVVRNAAESYLNEIIPIPGQFVSVLIKACLEGDARAPTLLARGNSPSSVYAPHQMVFVLFRQKLMKWSYCESNDTEVRLDGGRRK